MMRGCNDCTVGPASPCSFEAIHQETLCNSGSTTPTMSFPPWTRALALFGALRQGRRFSSFSGGFAVSVCSAGAGKGRRRRSD